MKHYLFFLVGLFSYAAFGDPTLPPTYLGLVKGVMFAGFHDRDTVNVDPGQILKCERKEVGSTLVVYRCDIKNSSITITNDRDPALKYDFTDVAIFYKAFHDHLIREFNFAGSVSEVIGGVPVSSVSQLRLSADSSTPTQVKGWLELPGYGLVGQITGLSGN
jgi:hypothetical protein